MGYYFPSFVSYTIIYWFILYYFHRHCDQFNFEITPTSRTFPTETLQIPSQRSNVRLRHSARRRQKNTRKTPDKHQTQ